MLVLVQKYEVVLNLLGLSFIPTIILLLKLWMNHQRPKTSPCKDTIFIVLPLIQLPASMQKLAQIEWEQVTSSLHDFTVAILGLPPKANKMELFFNRKNTKFPCVTLNSIRRSYSLTDTQLNNIVKIIYSGAEWCVLSRLWSGTEKSIYLISSHTKMLETTSWITQNT